MLAQATPATVDGKPATAKLIYFKDPWGTDQPRRGVTPAEFRTYFTGIDSNDVTDKAR
jgi:hypothetical protein